MNNKQPASFSKVIKDFFGLVRMKAVAFIVLTLIMIFFMNLMGSTLGGIFTQTSYILGPVILYILLSIIFSAFISKRHFAFAFLMLVILLAALWFNGYTMVQNRNRIEVECLKETNSNNRNMKVIKCMQQRGIQYYR
ncbi:MAG: hypothetical protein WCQ00_02935 [bacterium]